MHSEIPEDVPQDCIVYRVAKKAHIKPDGTPQSACFSDKGHDEDSYYMSVYFSDEMELAGKTVTDLQRHWGDAYTVLALSAAELRDQGERIWRDPNDEFPGHGACKRADGSERTRGQKRCIARIAKIAPELS